MMHPDFPFRDMVGGSAPHEGVRFTVRSGTGLRVVMAYHGQLSACERTAIGRFRLTQYVAAGLYDEARARRFEEHGDPSLEALAAHDMHIAVGDAQGRFLAYLCVQSAFPFSSAPTALRAPHAHSDTTRRLWERPRPTFPVETEYGHIYGHHPGLKAMPLHGVRELSRLVRNQDPALRGDPLLQLAVAETLVAGARLLYDRTWGIEAIVGCMAPDARRSLFAMGIPVAYAPEASVVDVNLGGGSPNAPDFLLWAPAAEDPGRFWPFAISATDLRRDQPYYEALDTVLAHSVAPESVLRSLKRQRLNAPRQRACYAAPAEGAGGLLWTDQPFIVDTGLSPAREKAPPDIYRAPRRESA